MLQPPSARSFARLFALIVLVFLVLLAGSIFFATHFVTGTVNYVVSALAGRSGLSPFLVRGIIIIVTIPFFLAVGKFARNIFGIFSLGWNPLSFYRKAYGLVILIYTASFFFAMYWASKDAFAYKYCGDTPEGVFVSDGTGKDPVYGIELGPCSLPQIEELRNGKGNLRPPREVIVENANEFEWFDGLTGKPRVWYSRLPNGDFEFFDRPGNDPHTGQVLHPVDSDVVDRMRRRQAADQAAKEQAAKTQAAAEAQGRAVDEATKKRAADVQAEAEREMEAKETQEEEASVLGRLTTEAQTQFDARDYKSAAHTCDQVLARRKESEPCATIRQRASVKLAEDLVRKGQLQVQQGEFDEALWSAEAAINLDPSNASALKLKKLVILMKPNSAD